MLSLTMHSAVMLNVVAPAIHCFLCADAIASWRHDTQHNDTQHNDTQHNNTQLNDSKHSSAQHDHKKCCTQHNIVPKVVMLGVVAP
jgi:hypothetical protein